MTKKNHTVEQPTSDAADTPSPPPSSWPRLTLNNINVNADQVTLDLQVSQIVRPTVIIANAFRDALPAWKDTSDAWKRFEAFQAHLTEAREDLANAEAAEAAAKSAWEQALRAGDNAESLERNYRDARREVEIIKEREAILKAKERELKSAVEAAWKQRLDEILAERRALGEKRVREARQAIGQQAVLQLAIVSITEEVSLAHYLRMGSAGVFSFSPPLF